MPGTQLCSRRTKLEPGTRIAHPIRDDDPEAPDHSPPPQPRPRTSAFRRDVPCTPLCPPSTSRPEARCAQCACLAIHGERTQGASSKLGGRPSLVRAAWSPPLLFSHDHAARATLTRIRRQGGCGSEGRRCGQGPANDRASRHPRWAKAHPTWQPGMRKRSATETAAP